jgi:hypothetical protein
MNPRLKCTVTDILLYLALACIAAGAGAAETVGRITHANGPLLVRTADGKNRILAADSVLSRGDTLLTRNNTYAKIRLDDDSEVVLQPLTTLTIDKFSSGADGTGDVAVSLALASGGVQLTAGRMGSRRAESVMLTTPAGQIDMSNASAIVQYQEGEVAAQAMMRARLFASMAALDAPSSGVRTDAPAAGAVAPLTLAQINLPSNPSSGGRAPGLYVQVLDGLIHVTNPTGTSNFAAGQFGYTANIRQPPIIIPVNPGIIFQPPPVFASTSAPSGSSSSRSNAVDCVVR